MGISWPLVGRTEELGVLGAALASPDVSGVVVRGAAGSGKSRIAQAALSASHGLDARWVAGTSAARTIPLGALTAWTPPGVTDTAGLLRGVFESLTAANSGAPLVLGVDDAHLLDDLSIFVVHQVVQRGAAKVLLTVVDGAPVPVAVQEIWKHGRFDRLDLQPLSATDTAALLSATLNGTVDADAVQRLWALTRGNPLYLRNIVEQEVTDGRLVQRDGHWRWVGDPIMPPGLVELIESRIGALPDPVSEVLDALAVGEPIELAVLQRMTDPAAVEHADIHGLIALEPVANGFQVRVAHPLYAEVRRRRAAPTRLRRLRGRLAAELATCPDGDDIQTVVRRAALSTGSDLQPDPELLVRAAHGAVWLADLPLADRLADAAIHAGAGPEPSLVRAHALSWLGRGEEADAILSGIDSASLTEGDRARLTFLRASNLLWALGDPARAKALIDAADPTHEPQARSYIDAFLTVYWFAVDQPESAKDVSTNLAIDELPAVVGAEIAWVLTSISGDAGRTSEAVAVAETGHAAATRSFDAPHMRFNIADAHVTALLLAGRVGEALEVAEQVRHQAEDLPGAAQSLGAAVAGRAALGAGRIDAALHLLGQATDALSGSHAIGWGYRYQVPRATALAMGGFVDKAAVALSELDRRHRQFRSLDYELSLARAWVAAGQGAVSEAIAISLAASRRASAKGQFAAEVICLQTATQFGDRSSAARLRELGLLVEGPRADVAARFAEALRDGDGDQLSSVSKEFEQIGDLVAAVDAAAHASAVYRGHDLRGSSLVCAARAEALATQCGAVTPALRLSTEPVPFTDREREIVTLISAGMSNRAIAERLTLSVRTVESHIYRAMQKTGVTSRDDLAAVLPGRR